MDETLFYKFKSGSGGNRLDKIYVLDTNVLLQDPLSIFSFETNGIDSSSCIRRVDSKKR